MHLRSQIELSEVFWWNLKICSKNSWISWNRKFKRFKMTIKGSLILKTRSSLRNSKQLIKTRERLKKSTQLLKESLTNSNSELKNLRLKLKRETRKTSLIDWNTQKWSSNSMKLCIRWPLESQNTKLKFSSKMKKYLHLRIKFDSLKDKTQIKRSKYLP